MASLADYTDLRVAVVEHVGRSDFMDVFKRLTLAAEDMFNRKIRHRSQITAATVTFTNGVASLPSDYLEMLHVYDAFGNELFEQPVSSQKATGNQYRYYAIDGSNIQIYGLTGNRDIVYFAKIPTVTDSDTDSNWLLSAYPDAYKYGVGFEAAKHIRDIDLAAATKSLLDTELSELKIDSDRARFGNSVVKVAGCTP